MKDNGAPTATTMKAISEADVRERIQSSSDIPLLYFNQARVVSSYYDIRVFLGTGSVTPQGQQTFVEQICIVMTPEFAKVLVTTVQGTVERYERLFGPLRPVPQQAQAPEPAKSRKPKKKTTEG